MRNTLLNLFMSKPHPTDKAALSLASSLFLDFDASPYMTLLHRVPFFLSFAA